MALFGAIGTGGSGMTLHRTWMDAVSDNIANVNTARPTNGEAFRARYIVAQANAYGGAGRPGGVGQAGQAGVDGGASVRGVELGDPAGRMVSQPGHPFADANGYVRYPDIDMGDQMVQLMMAQRGYQANVSAVEHAKEMYQQALQLGK